MNYNLNIKNSLYNVEDCTKSLQGRTIQWINTHEIFNSNWHLVYLGNLASLIARVIKESTCNAGDPSSIQGLADPLEKG